MGIGIGTIKRLSRFPTNCRSLPEGKCRGAGRRTQGNHRPVSPRDLTYSLFAAREAYFTVRSQIRDTRLRRGDSSRGKCMDGGRCVGFARFFAWERLAWKVGMARFSFHHGSGLPWWPVGWCDVRGPPASSRSDVSVGSHDG